MVTLLPKYLNYYNNFNTVFIENFKIVLIFLTLVVLKLYFSFSDCLQIYSEVSFPLNNARYL